MADKKNKRPEREKAEEAVKTLLAWMGEDPERSGVRRTPGRVLKSFGDWFGGYQQNPAEILGSSFPEADGYQGIVGLRNIDFESHCEHHMAPIIGQVHLAYMPDKRLVGISKLVRVVQAYAKRLQVQERLTMEIAQCIEDAIRPKGVAVVVEARHECMTTRGVHRPNVRMVTNHFTGLFRDDERALQDFFRMVHPPESGGAD